MISGEIFEKDISVEDMDALIELYKEETKKIKQNIKIKRDNIRKAIKNLEKK